MKKTALYAMILLYLAAGIYHFINPLFYLKVMPEWLPYPRFLVVLSGIAEIGLALLLVPQQTRSLAAWLIIAMLVVFFFLIHIPMVFTAYHTNTTYLIISLVRLPIQFVLIWWAWLYTKKEN